MKGFVKWNGKKGIWDYNLLEDINAKRVKRLIDKRKPFSESEIEKILDALKFNLESPKSSAFKHLHYYPFIYFVFKTGVRNAEAIGLRVSSFDLKYKRI